MPDTPPLKTPLPEDLFWLESDVRALQVPVALGTRAKEIVLKPGASKSGGIDIPLDAAWARGRAASTFLCHYEEGESCVLQLNLEDIPSAARKPEWPAVGVLWVFLEDRGRSYEATVQYDARPAADIPWGSLSGGVGHGITWKLDTGLPWATEKTLPSIANWPEMATLYDDWVQRHYLNHGRIGVVLGGYAFTNQGDHDADNEEFVLGIKDLYFGDSGEVYVFFNPARGFYGRADIC